MACAGDALAHVEAAGVARRLIPLVQVFARVSPEQKELVLLVRHTARYIHSHRADYHSFKQIFLRLPNSHKFHMRQ